jgi:2-methylcitrate dehydratase PrpD
MDTHPKSLLPNATADLAEFSSQLTFRDIPQEVVERMKTSLLDSLGCCLFGVTLPWTQKVLTMVMDDDAAPVASILGMNVKTSLPNAVLVNATAGHAFELDDIHKESIVHAGSIAVPVVLALAEKLGKSDPRQFLTAMVAGYEIGTRVGNAATMALFFQGFHPQGTSGAFVAAASASHMLGLNAKQTQHALGIVGSQAGGLMAAQEGAMVKRFHSGRAAQSGVYSALLAKDNFTGITDVLEAGYGGYLSSYSSKPNADRLTDGLGSVWETAKVGYKPHACVTSIHACLDAFKHLLDIHQLALEDIKQVEVGLSPMTYTHCAWEYKSQGVTAAQMNLFYSLTVMGIDGMAFVAQYDESRLTDPRILSFIPRIHAYIDREIEAMGPAYRHAARVEIQTQDGRTFKHETLNRRGSPENPLSQRDVVYKFRNVVDRCLSQSAIERVISLIERFEQLPDFAEFLSIIQAKPH